MDEDKYKIFIPKDYGLSEKFRLTQFSDLRFQPDSNVSSREIGIGLDSCLVPTRYENYSLLQTVDFFYPLIDNPYIMGKITCANVLSDLYAMGVKDVDNLSLMISVCLKMTDTENEIVVPLIIKGFQQSAESVGVRVNCQTSSYNPWCIIGGIATSLCTPDEYIDPLQAEAGDLLVLTKPLGAQMACNLNRWKDNPESWEKFEKVLSKDDVETAFDNAIASLIRLNRNAAILMHKYEAHAATDVTGFGLLGHAENLAKHQERSVNLMIDTLPVFKNMFAAFEAKGNVQQFLNGRSPETSGGLLVALPAANARKYCDELKEIDGCEAWIVGKVENGTNVAQIVNEPNVIHV